MSSFVAPGVVVHRAGRAAHGSALVGSVFTVTLEMRVQTIGLSDATVDGTPINLHGWTANVRGEVYEGSFDDDSNLVHLVGVDPVVPAVGSMRVALDIDQVANPGVFHTFVTWEHLPANLRNVAIDAPVLPTVCYWVEIAAPGGGRTEEARIAIGWRRGYRSV